MFVRYQIIVRAMISQYIVELCIVLHYLQSFNCSAISLIVHFRTIGDDRQFSDLLFLQSIAIGAPLGHLRRSEVAENKNKMMSYLCWRKWPSSSD
jgi:hypothetical protein